MTLIYLEGVDKSGKSTFLTSWARKYPHWIVLRWSYPDNIPDGVDHTSLFLGGNLYTTRFYSDLYARDKSTNILVYRCLLSEYAYASLYHRKVPLNLVQWWIDQQLRQHTIVAMFGVDHWTYLKRSERHPDRVPLTRIGAFRSVVARYEKIMQLLEPSWVVTTRIDGTWPFEKQEEALQRCKEGGL